MQFYTYLITDPKYYSDQNDDFKEKLENVLKKHSVHMASFRDKLSSEKLELAKIFLELCNKYNIKKTIINSDFNLAIDLNFSGVHLTSQQFDCIEFCKEKGLYVIISCHNFDEVKKAYEYGADAITYSPIFYTPFKGKPKGIESLKALVSKYEDEKDFKIIALGGIISQEQIAEVEKANADGFASIRYFIDN